MSSDTPKTTALPDIVERLREFEGDEPCVIDQIKMADAADEIERLRAIIASAAASLELMHPRAVGGSMTDEEMANLWNATQEMLSNG